MITEILIYAISITTLILLWEFILVMGKVIYDDFFAKNEIEIVQLDAEDWEMLKEQTKKWNERK